MADTITKITDLIDPEVMGDMISAKLPKKIKVAPFATVDTTLEGFLVTQSQCRVTSISVMLKMSPKV